MAGKAFLYGKILAEHSFYKAHLFFFFFFVALVHSCCLALLMLFKFVLYSQSRSPDHSLWQFICSSVFLRLLKRAFCFLPIILFM